MSGLAAGSSRQSSLRSLEFSRSSEDTLGSFLLRFCFIFGTKLGGVLLFRVGCGKDVWLLVSCWGLVDGRQQQGAAGEKYLQQPAGMFASEAAAAAALSKSNSNRTSNSNSSNNNNKNNKNNNNKKNNNNNNKNNNKNNKNKNNNNHKDKHKPKQQPTTITNNTKQQQTTRNNNQQQQTMTLCRGTLLGPPPTGHVPRFLDSGVFVSPVGGPSRSLLEVRGAPWVALPARPFFGFMCYVLGTKLGGVLLLRMCRKGMPFACGEHA